MEAVCIDMTQRVLIAEDDRELRELLALVLENAGYQVCQCCNGEQLLTRLAEQPSFDLVISDIRMPGLNGLEVLARRNRNMRKVPFICMTAFGDEQTHRKARHLGAAAVIDKPFELEEMMKLIAHVCLCNERIKGVDHENK